MHGLMRSKEETCRNRKKVSLLKSALFQFHGWRILKSGRWMEILGWADFDLSAIFCSVFVPSRHCFSMECCERSSQWWNQTNSFSVHFNYVLSWDSPLRTEKPWPGHLLCFFIEMTAIVFAFDIVFCVALFGAIMETKPLALFLHVHTADRPKPIYAFNSLERIQTKTRENFTKIIEFFVASSLCRYEKGSTRNSTQTNEKNRSDEVLPQLFQNYSKNRGK